LDIVLVGMCESTIGLQALLSRPLTERNLTALHECVLRTALYSSSYQAEWKIRTIEKSRIITANNRHNSVRYPFPQSIAAQSFQLTTSGIVSRTAFYTLHYVSQRRDGNNLPFASRDPHCGWLSISSPPCLRAWIFLPSERTTSFLPPPLWQQ
jgi:hypothetical protein